ncbi:hypothetical protein K0U00_31610, partial [Paenibacillus sepulcri]|nr:hypothetical protein [Paenibacillus sepulcri]
TRTASVIQQQLERGDLRVMHLLERLQSVRIGTTEEEEEAFVNLNTPASYEHYIMGQRNPSSDSTE